MTKTRALVLTGIALVVVLIVILIGRGTAEPLAPDQDPAKLQPVAVPGGAAITQAPALEPVTP